MKTKYYIVHILENGVWHYKKSYRIDHIYYECDTNNMIDNKKIYNVIDFYA